MRLTKQGPTVEEMEEENQERCLEQKKHIFLTVIEIAAGIPPRQCIPAWSRFNSMYLEEVGIRENKISSKDKLFSRLIHTNTTKSLPNTAM